MALFRMLCVHFQSYISSMKKMMALLMLLQYVVSLGIYASFWTAIESFGSTLTHEFCRGYSTKMAQVLMRKTKEAVEFGKATLHTTILFGQAFIALEFICYLVVYWSLREQNKSFIKIVQEDVLKARAKKNVITLTGQIFTFVIEVNFSMLIQIFLHFGKVGGLSGPDVLLCGSMLAMMAITASQILSSPELRRFVQETLRQTS